MTIEQLMQALQQNPQLMVQLIQMLIQAGICTPGPRMQGGGAPGGVPPGAPPRGPGGPGGPGGGPPGPAGGPGRGGMPMGGGLMRR